MNLSGVKVTAAQDWSISLRKASYAGERREGTDDRSYAWRSAPPAYAAFAILSLKPAADFCATPQQQHPAMSTALSSIMSALSHFRDA